MKRIGLSLFLLALFCGQAAAQFAHFGRGNPFSLGVNEGSVGEVGRVGLWLLEEQARFFNALRLAVEAAQANPWAVFWLAAVSFAYGIFHAAGPGHGKAVITSYMLANERALRRGVVLAGLAALLQAVVAIAIVGIASIILGATARKMIATTHAVEVASYVFIAALGLWLVWRKGGSLYAALRAPPLPVATRFRCESGAEEGARQGLHGQDCACIAPDPSQLGDGFSWRQGVMTVVAAGSRPCSGALLVLVFAAAQSVFMIGVWATFAMAVGTALTTAGLAGGAVLFKGAARAMLGARRRRAEIFGRLLEVGAACVVLAVGVVMLAGVIATGGAI
ncbi:nickel/cobalt transporter [Rhodoblastus acidophilus]|uniref:Nickel/cobalt efflux system n=1 Tax=Candidatus Rhodoblastus alkanivorans TaxID=2954117 RepID=A0ABS9Z5A4_9HYPH|nr:nickel/cobalt transporter [Candidatus Rhodoblastus alkanivorans]MCI4677723.1 nickel/cobalt transporter [Candidatus Rhodoblastus alkanivorans]MCI4682545.1 nickel/cobalt transporter [Candidatus Rhodoblastus alkanivorans]MDI4639851.1 nickel/cobalt transporter [Rhodoblastus acidophilus]